MDTEKDVSANKAETYHKEYQTHEVPSPPVVWYKHQGLRKLYAMMPILFLGKTSALSLLNLALITPI